MNLELCITQSKTGGEKFKSWSKRLWKLLNHYSSTTCPFKARKRRQPYENGLEWNHKWLRMVIIWMANTCKFQFKRFLKPKKVKKSLRRLLSSHHCIFSQKLNPEIESVFLFFRQNNRMGQKIRQLELGMYCFFMKAWSEDLRCRYSNTQSNANHFFFNFLKPWEQSF